MYMRVYVHLDQSIKRGVGSLHNTSPLANFPPWKLVSLPFRVRAKRDDSLSFSLTSAWLEFWGCLYWWCGYIEHIIQNLHGNLLLRDLFRVSRSYLIYMSFMFPFFYILTCTEHFRFFLILHHPPRILSLHGTLAKIFHPLV